MFALARIGVFVQRAAVKFRQRVGIPRKVTGTQSINTPIPLVTAIDKAFEIPRRTVTHVGA